MPSGKAAGVADLAGVVVGFLLGMDATVAAHARIYSMARTTDLGEKKPRLSGSGLGGVCG